MNKIIFEGKWKPIRSRSTAWWGLTADYDLNKSLCLGPERSEGKPNFLPIQKDRHIFRFPIRCRLP